MAVALYVQKFGGTSVGTPDRIREVADHAARCVKRGDQVVLVVSAMGKETDELLRLADDVSTSKPGREMDMLITGGERKACALVAMALTDLGIESESFTGSQAGFLTDTTHRNAKILEVNPHRIAAAVAAGKVPVVGGSQGVSTDHDVTFFGRGGSDTTAVALAHALDADACELYTDVPGVFTTDPRLVPEARKMDHISFDELLEMTATGCPKPAMRSVELARSYGVKLHVRSAFSWVPGTWVSEEPSMENAIISAVTHDTSEAKMTVSGVPDQPGVAAKLFRSLADAGVNVDMIVQNVSDAGATDISFTLPHDQVSAATASETYQASSSESKAVTYYTDKPFVANRGVSTVELVNLTNDAWFGDTPGPWQHLEQARMRAVEEGIPMIRVANTGVTAAFGPSGRVLGRIGLGETGFIDVAVPASLPPTAYAGWREWSFMALLLLL
ncbi:MAG: aspartate kinase, partial [Acidimicrobiia bacterium]|nr:aspartate kinase [Acidimicrobiia bacterium]